MLGLDLQVLRERDHGRTHYRTLVVVIVVVGGTVVAGATIGRTQAARVACPAGTPGAFVVHIERVSPVVACRQPAARIVTGRAVRAQDPGMVARLSVTGRAACGRALV